MTTLAIRPTRRHRPVEPTRLAWPFRVWLVLELLFGVVGFTAVFLSPQDTATNFAWTIRPPVMAAVLGAFYLATAVMLIGVAWARGWEEVRGIVVAAGAITSLMLVDTLLHWDVFSVGTPPFWIWLVSYVVPPPMLAGIFWWQQRRAIPLGARPTAPLPSWFRGLYGINGAVLVVVEEVLHVAPGLLVGHGPWAMTALTVRTQSGWLIGVGLLLLMVAWDGDSMQARFAVLMPLALGPALVFQLVRFGDQVDASNPALLVIVVDLLVLSAAATWMWLRYLRMPQLATIGIGGASVFLAALLVMPALRPDLDPMARWVAEYARGPLGWIMIVAYVALAAAVWTLARGLAAAGGFGRLGPVLLGMAGVGALVAAVLPQDFTTPGAAVTTIGTIRQLVLVPVFLSLFTALFLITRRFRGRPGFAAFHVPALVLTSVAVAALAVTFVADPSWRGLMTRIYDIAWTAWLLTTAILLRRQHGRMVRVRAVPAFTAAPERFRAERRHTPTRAAARCR
jgi:hypothetical protein